MIQIQPRYRDGEEWLRFAREEDLYFEALEPFMPAALGDPAERDACIAWYRDCGRTRSVHGAFIDVNPAGGDPLIREISVRRCRESCAAAREIGASHVVLHGSCFPFLRGGYIRSWADSSAEVYAELARTYPELTICIENSTDLDTTPLEMLMERIGEPNVCVCLDIGHARYSRIPLSEWFAKLGTNIGYLHLSDNNGAFDDHLPIGCGVIDWKEADVLYRSLERPVPVTVEIGEISDIRRSLAFLHEIGMGIF